MRSTCLSDIGLCHVDVSSSEVKKYGPASSMSNRVSSSSSISRVSDCPLEPPDYLCDLLTQTVSLSGDNACPLESPHLRLSIWGQSMSTRIFSSSSLNLGSMHVHSILLIFVSLSQFTQGTHLFIDGSGTLVCFLTLFLFSHN